MAQPAPAEARVLLLREDKPVTTLETRITNPDSVTVVDGSAVVWRDPVAAGERIPDTAPATQTTG